jgi:raffinose/stachyose/melibiose transport system permease protein
MANQNNALKTEGAKNKVTEYLYSVLLFFVLIIVATWYTIRNGIKFIALGIAYPFRWIDKVLSVKKRIMYTIFSFIGKPFIYLAKKIEPVYVRFINWLREKTPRLTEDVDRIFLGEGDTAQNNRVFFFFLLPALGSFILMVIVPFFMGIYYSLTDWGGIGDPNWLGLENYRDIFSEPKFYYSFYRTALYSIFNIIAINVVAFSLALLVTQKLKTKNIARAGFFMPNLIGGLVLGFIFQFIYSEALIQFGESTIITGLSNLIGRDIFAKSMLTSGATNSLIAIIIVVTWQYAGYIMMIYIAALQNIPQSLVEASKIDGANALQRLRNITMPLVAQAFTVAMFLTLVTSFKQFDTVFAMTGGGPTDQLPQWLGGFFGLENLPPVASLDLMAVNIYDTAFARRQFGFGQAKAIIFFIILLVISLLQVYYNKKREVEL